MYNNFVVEGEKMVLELLRDQNIELEQIIVRPEWLEEYGEVLTSFRDITLPASAKEIAQVSTLKTPPPILAVAKKISQAVDQRIINNNLSLYLDRIQNPGNFGTILRIADWFGIPYVFCSPDCADLYNPKTLQATMGAFLRVKVVSRGFTELQQAFPQLPVYGTILEGESIFEKELSDHAIIVIGSEGKGISDLIRPLISDPVAIPAHAAGGAESLNAAVATGIVCALFRNK